MAYFNKLYGTSKLIWAALFPQNSEEFSIHPLATGCTTTLTADNFSPALADINNLLRPDGTIELLFKDAMALAAPFLLYRCKSAGFSGCRAMVTPQGILLTGLR